MCEQSGLDMLTGKASKVREVGWPVRGSYRGTGDAVPQGDRSHLEEKQPSPEPMGWLKLWIRGRHGCLQHPGGAHHLCWGLEGRLSCP